MVGPGEGVGEEARLEQLVLVALLDGLDGLCVHLLDRVKAPGCGTKAHWSKRGLVKGQCKLCGGYKLILGMARLWVGGK